jgi:hypothetical protein
MKMCNCFFDFYCFIIYLFAQGVANALAVGPGQEGRDGRAEDRARQE